MVIQISSPTKKNKTFPLRIDEELNDVIDTTVFLTKAKSKHQYIINAVKEKLYRDMEGLRDGKISEGE